MTKEPRNPPEIGDIFNFGIGYNDSADFMLIRIKNDRTGSGEYGLLEMIDYSGPHVSHDIEYLATRTKILRKDEYTEEVKEHRGIKS